MSMLVVVGAHAFDAEAMAGGLIARWTRSGGRAELLHLTRGERGDPSRDPEAYSKQLEQELAASAAHLGAAGSWLGFKGGSLDSEQAVPVLLAELDRLQPALVVTHWRGSWHPRHRQAHEIVREAIGLHRHRARPSPALWYGETFEDLDGFQPNLYVALAHPDVERWKAAREAYTLYRAVQGRGPGGGPATLPYVPYYEAVPRVRGLECDAPLAQAFMQEPVQYPLDASLPGLEG